MYKLEITSQRIQVAADMFARLVDNNLNLIDIFLPKLLVWSLSIKILFIYGTCA